MYYVFLLILIIIDFSLFLSNTELFTKPSPDLALIF